MSDHAEVADTEPPVLWMPPAALARLTEVGRIEGLPVLARLSEPADLAAAELRSLLVELDQVTSLHAHDSVLVRHTARASAYFKSALDADRLVTLSWLDGQVPPPIQLLHRVRLSDRTQTILLALVGVLVAVTVLLAVLSVSAPVQALVEVWND